MVLADNDPAWPKYVAGIIKLRWFCTIVFCVGVCVTKYGSLSPRHGASSGYGWRVSANILNKQSRTADKGGPPAWGLGEVLTTFHKASDLN